MLLCGGAKLKDLEKKRWCQGAEGRGRGPNDEGRACHRATSLIYQIYSNDTRGGMCFPLAEKVVLKHSPYDVR